MRLPWFDSLEHKFDSLEHKFDSLEHRFYRLKNIYSNCLSYRAHQDQQQERKTDPAKIKKRRKRRKGD